MPGINDVYREVRLDDYKESMDEIYNYRLRLGSLGDCPSSPGALCDFIKENSLFFIARSETSFVLTSFLDIDIEMNTELICSMEECFIFASANPCNFKDEIIICRDLHFPGSPMMTVLSLFFYSYVGGQDWSKPLGLSLNKLVTRANALIKEENPSGNLISEFSEALQKVFDCGWVSFTHPGVFWFTGDLMAKSLELGSELMMSTRVFPKGLQ